MNMGKQITVVILVIHKFNVHLQSSPVYPCVLESCWLSHVLGSGLVQHVGPGEDFGLK